MICNGIVPDGAGTGAFDDGDVDDAAEGPGGEGR